MWVIRDPNCLQTLWHIDTGSLLRPCDVILESSQKAEKFGDLNLSSETILAKNENIFYFYHVRVEMPTGKTTHV